MGKKKGVKSEGSLSKSAAVRAYLEANPTAGPKEVAAGLAAQGLEVTPGQVSNIKWTLSKESSTEPGVIVHAPASEAAVKPSSNGASGAGNGASKSDAIRAYFKDHPGARNKEVIAALAAEGVAINAALVSSVKKAIEGGAVPGKRGRPARAAMLAAASPTGKIGGVSIDALLDAKKLVSQLGSVAAARQAIELLQKLAIK